MICKGTLVNLFEGVGLEEFRTVHPHNGRPPVQCFVPAQIFLCQIFLLFNRNP